MLFTSVLANVYFVSTNRFLILLDANLIYLTLYKSAEIFLRLGYAQKRALVSRRGLRNWWALYLKSGFYNRRSFPYFLRFFAFPISSKFTPAPAI